jgi:hypothetical protein
MPHELIRLEDCPDLPAVFCSRFRASGESGRLYGSDEFYAVFEHRPLSLEEVMAGSPVGPYPTEHLYAINVFYRASCDPHRGKKLPVFAYSLAHNDLVCPKKSQSLWAALSGARQEAGRIFPIVFTSAGQMNLSTLINDFTDESAKSYLLGRACEWLKLPNNSFQDVGPLSLGPDHPALG